jgi:hypothetical protein
MILRSTRISPLRVPFCVRADSLSAGLRFFFAGGLVSDDNPFKRLFEVIETSLAYPVILILSAISYTYFIFF